MDSDTPTMIIWLSANWSSAGNLLVAVIGVGIALWALGRSKRANSIAQEALDMNKRDHEYAARPILELMSFETFPSDNWEKGRHRTPMDSDIWGKNIFKMKLKNSGRKTAINIAMSHGRFHSGDILSGEITPVAPKEKNEPGTIPSGTYGLIYFNTAGAPPESDVEIGVSWKDKDGGEYRDTFHARTPKSPVARKLLF